MYVTLAQLLKLCRWTDKSGYEETVWSFINSHHDVGQIMYITSEQYHTRWNITVCYCSVSINAT